MTLLFRGVLCLFMMAVERCSVAWRSVLRHSSYYHLFILHNPTILFHSSPMVFKCFCMNDSLPMSYKDIYYSVVRLGSQTTNGVDVFYCMLFIYLFFVSI